MARFQYKMQNILDIKEKLEGQEKQQFALQNQKLLEEEEKMKRLEERRNQLIAEGKAMRSGVIHIQDIKDNTATKQYIDEQIKLQLMNVKAAQKNVEIARIRMQKAMQERQIHEKLREKAFAEFLQEESKKEAIEIDELTSFTYGKKIGNQEKVFSDISGKK